MIGVHSATIKNVGLEGTYIRANIQSISDAIRIYAGGICGISWSSSINNCYNIGTISANSAASDSYAGGICGINTGGSIINSYNISEIGIAVSTEGGYTVGAVSYAGGICGSNNGSVINSYNTGSVGATAYAYDTAGAMAGGISGNNSGEINACYSIGDISASVPHVTDSSESIPYAGGIVGNNSGTINACYSTGDVSVDSYYDTYYSVGGICGSNNSTGTFTNCYWNTDSDQTSNETSVASKQGVGVSLDGTDATTSRTTVQMKDRENYATNYVGFDFDNVWLFHDDVSINDGYPILQALYQEPPILQPTVTSVTVNPSTAVVTKGNTESFTATVIGENSPEQTVTWTVDGTDSGITDGLLTVGENETATMLTITATSNVDASKFGTAAVTVTESAPIYSATINPTSKIFPMAGPGYDNAAMLQEFTIENTGTGQITNLTASILSDSYDYTNFEIITDLSATALAPGEMATLSVRPASGLEQHTYADVLTITGTNGINLLVPLSFTVSDESVCALAVDPTSKTFTAAQVGYNNTDMTQIFTIENTGTEDITGLSASLDGVYFEIASPLSTTTVTSGSALTISIRPVNDLPANKTPYTDTLTIRGDNEIYVAVPLSFTVSATPTYTITIDPMSKVYTTAQSGYSNVLMAQVFTIQNMGRRQITGLSASLGGTSFEISTNLSVTTVDSGDTATISVRPANGLAANSTPYIDMLTITGSNGINITVPLSFIVEARQTSVLYGDLNSDGVVDSADLILMLRYFAQPSIVINIAAADVTGDGKVNSADLILLLRYFAQPGIVLGSSKEE